MAVIIRRLYFTKKVQIGVAMSLLVFLMYYVLFVPYQIKDVDFTKHDSLIIAEKRQLHDDAQTKKQSKHDTETPVVTEFRTKPTSNIEHSITNSQYSMHTYIKVNILNDTDGLDIHSLALLNLNNRDSIAMYIENSLQESLKEDKGTGCDIPKLDPFAKEVMQFNKNLDPIVCKGRDWVRCYFSKCNVNPEVIAALGDDIECAYRDIIYNSDYNYILAPPTTLKGDKEYLLTASDHVKISCSSKKKFMDSYSWVGYATAFRKLRPEEPPRGRENTLNVLIFGFDSTSKNGFIRKMPKSYKYITEVLDAVVLNGYNIVGDGTPAALFPILTGKNELELPECRKTISHSGHLDDMPFIFYKLKKDGYRTAYFEDMPEIGTFQYRFNGFRHQPSDHYLRPFYLEESKLSGSGLCVGDKPRCQLMMNITDQFMKLDGKRFAFTFVADITHNDFNKISNADEPFVHFLKGLLESGVLKDTLLFIMGDHGPRYANVRNTLQGKLEERLPLMAIRIPEKLKAARPQIVAHLDANKNTLTTPYDIHATILDALDMREHWNHYKVKGADFTRSMTLFEPIPKNRSCSEAGIESHWCTCLKWDPVDPQDPMFTRAAQALLDHINNLTEFTRSKCALRTLTAVDWVTKKLASKKMLEFKGNKDKDGYVGSFGNALKITKDIYQVKITVGPGNGAFEAAVTHNKLEDKFVINTRDISRINAYNKEPECVSATYPHLNPYCYCNT